VVRACSWRCTCTAQHPLGIEPQGPQDTVPVPSLLHEKDGSRHGLPDRLAASPLRSHPSPWRTPPTTSCQPLVDAHPIVPECTSCRSTPSSLPPQQAGRRHRAMSARKIAVLFVRRGSTPPPLAAPRSGRSTSGSGVILWPTSSFWASARQSAEAGTCRIARSPLYDFFHFSSAAGPGQDRTPLPLPPSIADAVSQRRRRVRSLLKTIVSAALALASLARLHGRLRADSRQRHPRPSKAAASCTNWPSQSVRHLRPRRRNSRLPGPIRRGLLACHSRSLLPTRNLMELRPHRELRSKGLIKDISGARHRRDGHAIERPRACRTSFKSLSPIRRRRGPAANNRQGAGGGPTSTSLVRRARRRELCARNS